MDKGRCCKVCVIQLFYTVINGCFPCPRYYLSRSRYSPLTHSQKKVPIGPAFGSSAPRWPVRNTVSSVANSTCDIQPQVYIYRCRHSCVIWLVAKQVTSSVVPRQTEGVLPPLQNRRGNQRTRTIEHAMTVLHVVTVGITPSDGWHPPVKPPTYHSMIAAQNKGNSHGRTDWTTK